MKRSAVTMFLFSLVLITFIPSNSTAKVIWAPKDCMVHAEAMGGGLRIKAHTPEPVQFWISVSYYNEPNSEGNFVPTIRPQQFSGGPPVKDFVANFPSLQHETMYYYVVKIFDMDDGLESYVVGAKWTNLRDLQIFFNQLDMHDDSDNTTAGDFIVDIWESGKGIFSYGVDKGDDWIDSGTTVYPNRQNMLKGVNSNYLDLYISGYDKDPSSHDRAEKTIKIGYQQQKAFSIRVTAPHRPGCPSCSTLDFTLHFTTKEHFGTPANTSVPDLSHLQPKQKLKFTKDVDLINPYPPTIESPPLLRIGPYKGSVRVRVVCKAKLPSDPIVQIKFTFAWFNNSCGNINNKACWEKKTIPGWQVTDAMVVSGYIPNSAFVNKGTWQMRARAITKSGKKSDWSDWRKFNVQ